MILLKKLFLLTIISLVLMSCKEKSTPTNEEAVTPTVTKSAKRGIAFDLASTADFTAVSKGVSWWYNWWKSCNSNVPATYYQTYGMDFIPMLSGGNTSTNDMTTVKNFMIALY